MPLPVALQLYSVRDQLEIDYRGTIEKVATMGYQGVELSGFTGKVPPEEVKKILDEFGLKTMSTHCPFEEMLSNTENVFKNAHICGLEYVVIPWLNKNTAFTDDEIGNTISNITELGKKAKENGLTLLYHNHDFEFEKKNGKYIIDIIYESVPAEYLQTQFDTCWVKVGGEDPAEYVKKYRGRTPIVHLKDSSGSKSEGMYELIGNDDVKKKAGEFNYRPIGSGLQDIPSILKASEEAGAKWVVVEQDESNDMPTLDAAKMSREYLKSLGW